MATISNESIKKKIQSAADKAGMSEDELIGFITSSTANAPYFLDFLRRALPDGGSASLPGEAGQPFDNWVRALHARSAGAGCALHARSAAGETWSAAPFGGHLRPLIVLSLRPTTDRPQRHGQHRQDEQRNN